MSPGQHRSSHLAGALALTVLALVAPAGCGGGKTNGLETMSAAEVHRKAAAALRSAHSAHVKGVSAFNGNPVQLDLRFDGSSTSGALVADGVRFGITRIADVTYIKGGRQALEQLGAPYPLRGDFKGPAAGRIDFSEYGADFRITAPEEPLDVGKLPVRG